MYLQHPFIMVVLTHQVEEVIISNLFSALKKLQSKYSFTLFESKTKIEGENTEKRKEQEQRFNLDMAISMVVGLQISR